MRKTLSLFILLLLVGATPAPPKLLVVPGKSLGPIVLGLPLSPAVFKLLGEPSGTIPATRHPDSGSVEFRVPKGKSILVKLHDGVSAVSVHSVFITDPRAKTAQGVGPGSPAAAVPKALPGGRWTVDALSSLPCWESAGLDVICTARNGTVRELFLHRTSPI